MQATIRKRNQTQFPVIGKARVFTALAASMALAACGGGSISPEVSNVGIECADARYADAETCLCIAKKADRKLSDAEMDVLSNLFLEDYETTLELNTSGRPGDKELLAKLNQTRDAAVDACR